MDKQKELISDGEKHIQMSAYVPQSWNTLRIDKGASWRGIISIGIGTLGGEKAGDEDLVARRKIERLSALLDSAYKRIQQLESKVDVSTAQNG